jgi:hypothetical protein
MAGIAGQSVAITTMLEKAVKLAETALPVLIVGEPGLGRTTLARAIHALGGRQGPVLVLDARNTSDNHEEFLFGSEPSHGRLRRSGALEAANATVVVQDASSLSRDAQARMADWLERDTFERVGGERPHRARARLIAIARPETIGADPPGGLRPDLARRLGAARINVPSLRDRPEDIPTYARMVLESVGRSGRARALEISADGYRTLFAHGWPDNTRELRQVVERGGGGGGGSGNGGGGGAGGAARGAPPRPRGRGARRRGGAPRPRTIPSALRTTSMPNRLASRDARTSPSRSPRPQVGTSVLSVEPASIAEPSWGRPKASQSALPAT